MALTEQQTRLALTIDTHVRQVLAHGGGDEAYRKNKRTVCAGALGSAPPGAALWVSTGTRPRLLPAACTGPREAQARPGPRP